MEKVNEKPTHLDLFSGIGGFALAAKWAGFRTIGFCEIDKYCQRVISKNFINVQKDYCVWLLGDIRELDGRDFYGVDLITGGFPCQPFSCAGKRRGAADDRHLWPEMLRIITEARPAWMLGENVAGIIGMELDTVLSDLETIGYACRPFVIPACGVDARHRRNRVWIVAHANGAGRGEQCWTEPISASNDSAECGCRWLPEPDVGRVAHGIPARVDRLRGLGNAIVPQVAHQILQAIYAEIKKNAPVARGAPSR